MSRATCGRSLFMTVALISMLLLIVGTVAARERQLAGVHLNDHAIDLLDIYGPPDGIVTGPPGPAFPPEVAAMGGGMGMPGAPGMPGPGDMLEQGSGGPRGLPGGGAGALIGGPAGAGGAGAFPGAPPLGAGGPAELGAVGAGAAGQVQAAAVPNWALPVYIDTQASEMMWMYQRGPVTMGFLLDLDGYVQAIAVAADECSYVRTANWQPHKYVKLGNHYTRVLQRYGWPDETKTYTASGMVGTAASPSVTFNSISKTFSRDCVMRYSEGGNNIDFTLHDFRVVRIHIWD